MDAQQSAESEQSKLWNGLAGQAWIELQDAFDRSLKPFEDLLVDAVAAQSARRVLDVGCGTGRHVAALRERGYDAFGADASEEMLERARELCGGGAGLFPWRLGDPPPPELEAAAPFDAITGLGNLWPLILDDADARRAATDFRRLLRPGGALILGLHTALQGLGLVAIATALIIAALYPAGVRLAISRVLTVAGWSRL